MIRVLFPYRMLKRARVLLYAAAFFLVAALAAVFLIPLHWMEIVELVWAGVSMYIVARIACKESEQRIEAASKALIVEMRATYPQSFTPELEAELLSLRYDD